MNKYLCYILVVVFLTIQRTQGFSFRIGVANTLSTDSLFFDQPVPHTSGSGSPVTTTSCPSTWGSSFIPDMTNRTMPSGCGEKMTRKECASCPPISIEALRFSGLNILRGCVMKCECTNELYVKRNALLNQLNYCNNSYVALPYSSYSFLHDGFTVENSYRGVTWTSSNGPIFANGVFDEFAGTSTQIPFCNALYNYADSKISNPTFKSQWRNLYDLAMIMSCEQNEIEIGQKQDYDICITVSVAEYLCNNGCSQKSKCLEELNQRRLAKSSREVFLERITQAYYQLLPTVNNLYCSNQFLRTRILNCPTNAVPPTQINSKTCLTGPSPCTSGSTSTIGPISLKSTTAKPKTTAKPTTASRRRSRWVSAEEMAENEVTALVAEENDLDSDWMD